MSILKKRGKSKDQLVAEERAILQATEIICEAMDSLGVSRKELARRLGVSGSEVTQRLQGRRNLTLRSLVDMLYQLNRELIIDSRPLSVTAPQPIRHLRDVSSGWTVSGSAARRPAKNVAYEGSDVYVGRRQLSVSK